MRLGNGNESDSSAPTIRLATLIRGARTAAGGERARILGVGASTSASTPVEILGSARRRHLICARAHLLRRAPQFDIQETRIYWLALAIQAPHLQSQLEVFFARFNDGSDAHTPR